MKAQAAVVTACLFGAAAAYPSSAVARDAAPASVYVISIGFNGVPQGFDPGLEPLRFADDDAIAFFAFAARGARRAYLLTAPDRDTQARLGAALPAALPPTLVELRAAVARLQRDLQEDATQGRSSVAYIYYSGHGAADSGQEPALALADARLTRKTLYDDVLAALPAREVHLFVDACHAEAVVRPRDAQAHLAEATDEDWASVATTTTLARFPTVGAIVAATRGGEAHEWNVYQGGVFTHELLSALRGAADVNGDLRVEYSEVAAFLAAANRSVDDPRARLDALAHAPPANPRVAIVDLRARDEDAVIEADGTVAEHWTVESAHGDRLADVHAEPGQPVRIFVPAPETLVVRSPRGEAPLNTTPGRAIPYSSLNWQRDASAPRGSVATALHRGLFATPFGPAYYRGYVDRASDWVPVVFARPSAAAEEDPRAAATTRRRALLTGTWASFGVGVASTAVASAFGWRALNDRAEVRATDLERPAAAAAQRYTRDSAVAWSAAGVAVGAVTLGIVLLVLHSGAAPRDPAAWLAGPSLEF